MDKYNQYIKECQDTNTLIDLNKVKELIYITSTCTRCNNEFTHRINIDHDICKTCDNKRCKQKGCAEKDNLIGGLWCNKHVRRCERCGCNILNNNRYCTDCYKYFDELKRNDLNSMYDDINDALQEIKNFAVSSDMNALEHIYRALDDYRMEHVSGYTSE